MWNIKQNHIVALLWNWILNSSICKVFLVLCLISIILPAGLQARHEWRYWSHGWWEAGQENRRWGWWKNENYHLIMQLRKLKIIFMVNSYQIKQNKKDEMWPSNWFLSESELEWIPAQRLRESWQWWRQSQYRHRPSISRDRASALPAGRNPPRPW